MKKLLLLFVACLTIVACQKESTSVENVAIVDDVMIVDQSSNVLGGLIANPPLGSNSINTDEAGKNPKHGINVRFAATGEDKFIRAYLHPTFIEKYDEENIVIGFGFKGEGGYEVAGGIYEESYTHEGEIKMYYWAQDFYGLWSTDEYSSLEALADSFDSPEKEFDDKEKFFYFTMDQAAVLGDCGAAITSGPLGADTDISVVYNGNVDPKKAEDRGNWLRLNASLNDIKDDLAGTVIYTEDDDYLYVEYAENARVYVKPVKVVSHTTTPTIDENGFSTYMDVIELQLDDDSNPLGYAFQKGHLLQWFCGEASFSEADTTAPNIATSGSVTFTLGDEGEVVFENDEDLPMSRSINGGDASVTGYKDVLDYDLFTIAGVYTIVFTATDEAGNVGTAEAVVTVVAPCTKLEDLAALKADIKANVGDYGFSTINTCDGNSYVVEITGSASTDIGTGCGDAGHIAQGETITISQGGSVIDTFYYVRGETGPTGDGVSNEAIEYNHNIFVQDPCDALKS